MTNFLIGASTSAHQIEGNNIHSDYWAMEHMKYTSFTEPSGQAVDSYNRYEEDIALLKQAGLNAYRFSIEWARIEPEQGKFDMNEIEHYRKVLLCLKENGITPVVTMHHFTSPLWLIQMGGWENEKVVDLFANYCKFVVEQLGDYFDYVCTINEANMRLQFAAIAERIRRQMMANAANMKSMEGTVQVGANLNGMMERMKMAAAENMQIFHSPNPAIFISACTPNGDLLVMKAHQAAKAVMKQVKPSLKIGLTLSLHDIQFVEGGEEVAKKEWNDEFLHYLPYIQDDDFFGLQNYTRSVMNADGIMPVPEGKKKTQMDYENYPEALGHVIRKVHESLPIPIMVTENGITTSDDTERVEFIQKALSGVQACIADGIPVIGYMHWSLLDNFEWQKGFAMTFGLIAVDRTTMKRTPKQSLFVLGSYAK